MKIILLTAGSRGDTQPFIALGIELKKLGNEVVIVGAKNFLDLVNSYGLEFRSINVDVESIMKSGKVDSAINADSPIKMLLSLRNNNFMTQLVQMQDDFYNSCHDADAIIYHPGATIGHFIAKEKNIPCMIGSPFPMSVTDQYPAIIFYDKNIPKIFNKVTHKIFISGFWMATKLPLKVYLKNKRNKNEKLPNPLKIDQLVVSCSNQIFETKLPAHSSGYWNVNTSNTYQLSEKIDKFLSEGEKPIYIGFGSLGNSRKAKENTELFIKAVIETKRRAIISTGFGGFVEMEKLPENILMIKEIPHDWLFPKMSLIIHHGGAGTTASAFHAGIPQLIIPHGNDQFAWGKRVYELGVGSEPIKIKDINLENIKKCIEYASNDKIILNAKILGEKLSNENGARDTALFVHNYFMSKDTKSLKVNFD